MNGCTVSSVCTRGIQYRGIDRGLLTCYPDAELAVAKELMEAKGVKQLPVVRRGGDPKKDRKRKVVALLNYDSIWHCLRFFCLFFITPITWLSSFHHVRLNDLPIMMLIKVMVTIV